MINYDKYVLVQILGCNYHQIGQGPVWPLVSNQYSYKCTLTVFHQKQYCVKSWWWNTFRFLQVLTWEHLPKETAFTLNGNCCSSSHVMLSALNLCYDIVFTSAKCRYCLSVCIVFCIWTVLLQKPGDHVKVTKAYPLNSGSIVEKGLKLLVTKIASKVGL